MWEEASNCHKLLRSKAAVVNVMVKGVTVRSRQVRMREMSANEPLTKHRKDSDDTKTGVSPVSWEKHGRYLLTIHAVSGVQAA